MATFVATGWQQPATFRQRRVRGNKFLKKIGFNRLGTLLVRGISIAPTGANPIMRIAIAERIGSEIIIPLFDTGETMGSAVPESAGPLISKIISTFEGWSERTYEVSVPQPRDGASTVSLRRARSALPYLNWRLRRKCISR